MYAVATAAAVVVAVGPADVRCTCVGKDGDVVDDDDSIVTMVTYQNRNCSIDDRCNDGDSDSDNDMGDGDGDGDGDND